MINRHVERVVSAGGIAVLIGICVLVLIPSHEAVAQSDRTDQARTILQEGGYQQEIPDINAEGERSEGPGEQTGNQQQDVTDAEGADEGFGALVGGVLEALMWVGVLLACFGAVYLLLRVLSAGPPETEETTDSPDEADVLDARDLDRSGMEETLSDADDLARDGRYTDAIRRMFIDATERIERDLDVSLSKSDTNHEYLERIPGTGNLRELCSKLVTAVDRYYYGGKSCEESDYRRCRRVWKQVQSRSGSGGSA